MTSELIKNWLLVWNRRPGVFQRKQGMQVFNEFKGHLTTGIKAKITGSSMNTDLVVIPGGMTLIQLVNSEWLLTGNHALIPAGSNKKSSRTFANGS
jgi:hypothetical protein